MKKRKLTWIDNFLARARVRAKRFYHRSGVRKVNAVYDKLKTIAATHVCKAIGIDPAAPAASPIIDIIIQLLPIILPLILQCFAPKPAATVANNPGLLYRFRLRAIVRDAVPGMDPDTAAIRDHVFNALLAAGKTVTEEDMAAVAAG